MKYVIFIAGLFFIVSATAFNNYYCPRTGQSVAVGDNMTRVYSVCGVPSSESSQQQTITTSKQAVQWVYTRGNVMMSTQGIIVPPNAASLIYTIQNGIVIGVTHTGQGFVGSVGCNIANSVGVNSTAAAVQLLCGNPTYVFPAPQTSTSQQTIATWIYNNGAYQPQTILTFTGGILTKISTGQVNP